MVLTREDNSVIRMITASGMVSTFSGSGLTGYAEGDAATAKYKWPTGLAFVNESLFVADYGNHVIRKVASDGSTELYAGIPGHSGYVNGDK